MRSLKRRTTTALAVFTLLALGTIGFAAAWPETFSAVLETTASAASKKAKAAPEAAPLVPGVCNLGGPANAIEIESSGGTALAGYTTLTAGFAAINAGTHTGTITIDVCDNTNEGTGSAVLNASGSGAASYTTIVMSPAGGATRTITGATTAGNPLVDLNGADNVTINGLNTGGNSLIISNTTASATSGTSTIRFQADATTNLITNTSIQGSSASAQGTNGGNIWFGSAAITAGNDNNTVSNCDIGPAGVNLPSKGVYFSGTSNTDPGTANSGNIITGNNFIDVFAAGVSSAGVEITSGSVTTTVSNNKFYQTATRTFTAAVNHTDIRINNTSGNGYQVTGNTVGFANSAGTGTATYTGAVAGTYKGIHLIVGALPASNIQNNTVANISFTTTGSGTTTSSPFMALYPQTGLITTTGNTIGSQTGTGSISYSSSATATGDVIGIFNFSSQNSLINNNNIGSITATNTSTGAIVFYGIRTDLISTTTATVTGNNIGGTTADSINNTATATGSRVVGAIHVTGPYTFSSNNVRNMTMLAANVGTGSTASVAGVSQTSANVPAVISQNTISALANNNATAAVNVAGISHSAATTASTNLVARNLIYGLTTPSTSATATVNGIQVTSGVTTYQNNMIALGAGLTAGPVVNGITETGGTNNFFHNSVYIGGTGIGGTANTFAFSSTVTTNTRSFRDNIFFNARSNGAGTGKHYAVRVGGTAPNPAGLTINNNLYFANGTGAVFGFFNSLDVPDLATWKSNVGQDANSIYGNPQYNDPTNAVPDLHLHPTNPTPAESNGGLIAAVTDDYDGQTRSTLTPVDIGADAGNFVGLDLSAPAITYTALLNTSSTANRILSVNLVDSTGVATGGNAPRIYFNKNAGAYSSTACVLATGTVNNGNWNCTIDNTLIGGVVVTDVVRYFVVAQDTVGNLASNPSAGFTGTNVNTVTTPPTTPNQYTIVGSISGAFNVGVGGTYTSLTNVGGIFEAINNNEVIGNITINITTDLAAGSGTLVAESGTVALNQYASGFTVTIQSSGGARLIEGAGTSGLIRLSGADNVSINGASQLRFRNTSASGPALVLTNDATSNFFQSAFFESANTSTTSGTVVFGTSTGTAGNSGNTLNGCEIRDRSDAAGVPANGVYSAGTAGALNAGNFISNGFIYNFTNAGVNLTATGMGDGWTINTNSLYQTAARTTAMTGIAVLGGSGHLVSNNRIGGTAALAGGTFLATSQAFRGIDLLVGTASPTSVVNNTVKNIRSTLAGSFTSSYGIFVQGGTVNLGNTVNTSDGNFIGSSDPNERYEISGDSYAIRIISTTTCNVRNNVINNFGTAAGVPTGEFYFGISLEGTGGAHSAFNNTITNVTNGSTPDASFNTQTIGLTTTATGIQTIRQNTISNIGSTTALVTTALNNRVWGMVISASAAGTVVERNNITAIYGSSPTTGARADVVTALQVQGTNTAATLSNNFVAVDGGTAGSSDRPIFGILELSSGTGTSSFQHNSVNVYGTSTLANNTYAYNRNSTQTTVLRNNIFSNQRAVGTGFNVAMANTNAAATGWNATASNYNLVFNATPAHVTQWLGAAAGNNQTLAGFQAASLGDANSITGNPLFISNTDLHIVPTSPATSAGITFGGITIDYDNDPRPSSNPDIGADEIVQSDAGTFPAGTFYNAIAAPATYAGNVTVTNALYFNGVANIGANTLTVNCTATMVGYNSANFIIGNLQRQMCAPGVYDFPVGTAGNGSARSGEREPEGFTAEYSPATITVNSGTFPSSLAISVVDTWLPQLGQTSSISRYWNVVETGDLNVDMTMQYLPEDVYGNEPLYKVFKYDGVFATEYLGGSVNTGLNTFTAPGVTSFSGWAAGVQNVTAASADISGRVLTADGRPIANVKVVLSGGPLENPIVVYTGQLGYYAFNDLPVGQNYVVTVKSRRFPFTNGTRVITLNEDLIGFDFFADPQE